MNPAKSLLGDDVWVLFGRCALGALAGMLVSCSLGFSCAIETYFRMEAVSTSILSGALLIDIREPQRPQQGEEVGERDGCESPT